MTWRTDTVRHGAGGAWDGDREAAARGRVGQAGFTLIEMIVVLVVLGLALGLVLARGPMHSPSLDARMAAREVGQALRLARSRAIAQDQSVSVWLDVVARVVRVDGSPPEVLPGGIGVAVASPAGQAMAGRLVSIRFAPDGSSSGGLIVLGRKPFVRQVVVDWLTGRVSVDDAG
jgi:general secretion pathway protein H